MLQQSSDRVKNDSDGGMPVRDTMENAQSILRFKSKSNKMSNRCIVNLHMSENCSIFAPYFKMIQAKASKPLTQKHPS